MDIQYTEKKLFSEGKYKLPYELDFPSFKITHNLKPQIIICNEQKKDNLFSEQKLN